ncbi:uncharacterized protein BYT42DRAFT_567779 [Radiomyces spectabilis]|uniref:uncharacterized protein n=1 Tax=Radiomyces spectabilis TaxID=64574 RepID=UPI00221E4C37|nr:uncharacterized protein BYT42DRAFT_567779 [Radiomyces spectabilis]KAI8379162.1 hypothetical protein BYT42DRAFT_567779 [Radiomyces spectabilis]
MNSPIPVPDDSKICGYFDEDALTVNCSDPSHPSKLLLAYAKCANLQNDRDKLKPRYKGGSALRINKPSYSHSTCPSFLHMHIPRPVLKPSKSAPSRTLQHEVIPTPTSSTELASTTSDDSISIKQQRHLKRHTTIGTVLNDPAIVRIIDYTSNTNHESARSECSEDQRDQCPLSTRLLKFNDPMDPECKVLINPVPNRDRLRGHSSDTECSPQSRRGSSSCPALNHFWHHQLKTEYQQQHRYSLLEHRTLNLELFTHQLDQRLRSIETHSAYSPADLEDDTMVDTEAVHNIVNKREPSTKHQDTDTYHDQFKALDPHDGEENHGGMVSVSNRLTLKINDPNDLEIELQQLKQALHQQQQETAAWEKRCKAMQSRNGDQDRMNDIMHQLHIKNNEVTKLQEELKDALSKADSISSRFRNLLIQNSQLLEKYQQLQDARFLQETKTRAMATEHGDLLDRLRAEERKREQVEHSVTELQKQHALELNHLHQRIQSLEGKLSERQLPPAPPMIDTYPPNLRNSSVIKPTVIDQSSKLPTPHSSPSTSSLVKDSPVKEEDGYLIFDSNCNGEIISCRVKIPTMASFKHQRAYDAPATLITPPLTRAASPQRTKRATAPSNTSIVKASQKGLNPNAPEWRCSKTT